jgi:DNA mismatch repair protein MutL
MIRELPESLINQIAAGEVVERPASVVKELCENALDAGAGQIIIDVVDGGRTLISVIDDGSGMGKENLEKSILRHATSKLPNDDLLNINFMGFRGEALPSIASVSDMTIDTKGSAVGDLGLVLDCNTGDIKPSSWDLGTRIRVENLFGKTPARLKFLRGDRGEMMSVVEIVKRLAMRRPDVGFVLNNRWRFPKGQTLSERIVSVMGEEVRGRMIEINAVGAMRLYGFISEPTLRRASSVDQYLFVNGRPVKDKVLVGALRAAYMDVMHAREFPLCALYLELDSGNVDVNVSPAKTEVHFLEPSHVRGFIIKTLRARLAVPLKDESRRIKDEVKNSSVINQSFSNHDFWAVHESIRDERKPTSPIIHHPSSTIHHPSSMSLLGRVIGQYGNKYILAQNESGLVIIDQHAAHERIVYENLRNNNIKIQPLLTPIVIRMKPEQVDAIIEIKDNLEVLAPDRFGDDAIAIYQKPADWNLDWDKLLHDIADEVMVDGASAQLQEKLHLKLANYACHHSVRRGQRLDYAQMDALLRDIEQTERAGQCNHGRPVYKVIKMSELDGWFER